MRIVATVAIIAIVAFASWRVRVWMLKHEAEKQAAASAAASAPEATPSAGGTTATTAPSAPAAASAATPEVDARPIEIDLSVTADCWVRAVADGTQAFAQVIHAGEHQHVSASRIVLLDVGSAGALTWSINGRAANSIGAPGAHKQITITPANFSDYLK